MVNCYLLTGKDGAVLVDTGETGYEEKILKACAGKNVRLIMLTHGHIDHIQNAAYLARELKAPIGMNEKDLALKQNQFAQPLSGTGIFGKILGGGVQKENEEEPDRGFYTGDLSERGRYAGSVWDRSVRAGAAGAYGGVHRP